MKSFNKFMGITAVVLVVLLITSITVISIYVSSHKNLWNELGNFRFMSGPNVDFEWNVGNGQPSSSFETLTASQTDSFDLPEKMVIDVSIENVTFIEEDREDIMVEYYNEYPDSPLYDVTYKVEEVNDTLYLNTSYSVTDIMMDKDYDSYIKIHVPNDYECDTLDLTMSLGEINQESIFDGIKNMNLTASLGNINLTIDSPKDHLSVTCEMGDVDLTVTAPVESLDANSNFGEVTLNLQEHVGTLWTNLDMGSLEISADESIDSVTMTAKMGSINGDFNGHIGKLSATADMGSIDVYFSDNDDSTVYVDANMGEANSDLPAVKESADPDFKFYANLGSINIDAN